MRKKRLLHRILCGVFIYLFAGPPAHAQNVSVTDYSVPVSRADNLRIDGLSFNFVTEDDEIKIEGGSGAIVYKRFYNSLPYAYSFDFIGTASYTREQTTGNRTGTFASNMDIKVQKYFRETNKFFYSLSPSILYRKDSDRPQTDVTIGLGYGRFINATPLRKAVRIEDFLVSEGIITKRLPKKTMIELGHIIDKEDEYRDLYGDSYENYWYEDMSNEVNKTGLVLGNRGNVGPIGILRMREVLRQESISNRFFGWDASAGVQYRLLTEESGQARPSPSMAISLRYSRPISWSTQINTDLKFDTPFNNNFGKTYSLTQKIDIIYELSNKIAFTILNTITANKKSLPDALATALPGETPRTDVQLSIISGPSFSFFIENKIFLNIIEQISKSEGSPFRQSFSISLNYRIF